MANNRRRVGNNRSRVIDKNQYCEFVIQCYIDEGRAAEVDTSKSKLELKSNLELKRKIADELLIEILIRLPVKCVCRYRAVNKHWCNLISSNLFINRLRELKNGSHFIPNSFTLVFQEKFLCRSVSAATNSFLEPLPVHPDLVLCKSYHCRDFIPPLIQSKSMHGDTVPTAAVASCRDLLLCTSFQFSCYYVVNLITKQSVVLPSPPPLDHERPAKIRKQKAGILCYDSDGIASGWCRYKVIVVSNPPEFGSCLFTLRIFCSESGEWTKLMVDWYPWTAGADFFSSHMVAHSGMLYWVNGSSLVSLDLFNGEPDGKLSHTINLPEGVVCDPHYNLGVSQGHLCVATLNNSARSSSIKVWQVEDYRNGLWKLLYDTTLPFSCYVIPLTIVAFHPYRSDAIFVQRGRCFSLLDMENVKFDRYLEIKVDEDCRHLHNSRRAVLLRHQWFPTLLPSSCPLLHPSTLSSSSNLSSHPTN